MGISTIFQKRLQELVDEEDTKKSILNKALGVDARSLSSALNYGIIPKPRTLIRIADYFNVSISYLLGKNSQESFYKAEKESNFNERLTLLCKQKDMSYYKLSLECHFDKSYISRWLHKNQLPSFEILDILCDYFNVSIDYLLGRTDEKD